MNNGNDNHHDRHAALHFSDWGKDANSVILPVLSAGAVPPGDRLEGKQSPISIWPENQQSWVVLNEKI